MVQIGTYQFFRSMGSRSFAIQITLPLPISSLSSLIPPNFSGSATGSSTPKFLIAPFPGEADLFISMGLNLLQQRSYSSDGLICLNQHRLGSLSQNIAFRKAYHLLCHFCIPDSRLRILKILRGILCNVIHVLHSVGISTKMTAQPADLTGCLLRLKDQIRCRFPGRGPARSYS